MKKREKFLCIFVVVMLVVTILAIIDNIPNSKSIIKISNKALYYSRAFG